MTDLTVDGEMDNAIAESRTKDRSPRNFLVEDERTDAGSDCRTFLARPKRNPDANGDIENLARLIKFTAVPPRVSLLISILRLNLVLTYGIPPEFRGKAIYETAIRHRVSPESIGSRNCVPMAFTAESPQAQGQ